MKKLKQEEIEVIQVLEFLKQQKGKETIYLKKAVDRAGIKSLSRQQVIEISSIFTEENPEYKEYRILKANTPVAWQSHICTTAYTRADLYDIKYKFGEDLTNSETPGERIVRIRTELGMTRKDLSMKTGVMYRTLQNYELGERDINHATAIVVKKIAEALNVTMEDILG